MVVPAYNSARTIGAALKGAFGQTRPPAEVIVVDDGSRDETAEIVRREFPEVVLLQQANSGPSAARNRAAETARGDWLAFLDADDVWLPDKLDVQLQALAAHGDCAMCSAEWVRDAHRAPPPPADPPLRRIRFEDILRLNRFQTSTVLVRREIWQAVGGFRPEIDGTEDWDFWMRAARRTDDLHIAWPLVVYRDEGESYSKNSRRVYDAMHRMLASPGTAALLPEGAYRRLLAWHDVRFAYAFWRLGRMDDMRYALRHGRSVASPGLMADVALRDFLPYLWRRSRRPFGR